MSRAVHLSVVVNDEAPEPPYPGDTRARGWRFELDYERIEQSDTWAIAPPDLRPWLLMLWVTAWRQVPCGSLPNDPALIAARIGMPVREFELSRDVLMRGWRLHSDGRLYHGTITERVLSLLGVRRMDADRRKRWRERHHPHSEDVTRDSDRTPDGRTLPEPEPEPDKDSQHYVLGVLADPGGSSAPTPPSDENRQEAEEHVVINCPAQRIVDLYHERLPTAPRCLVLTQARRGYLRARWREYAVAEGWQTVDEGLAFFAAYFDHVATSKFLTGRSNGRDGRAPFVADIEWLFRPGNFAKVSEGKYHA